MGQEGLERGRERRKVKRRQVEGGRHRTGRFGTKGGKDERLKGDRWREDDMGQEGLERGGKDERLKGDRWREDDMGKEGLERGRERRNIKRRQVEGGRQGTRRFGTREGKTKG